MNTLITATGKQFDCNYAVANGAMLHVKIVNTDLATIAATFADPAETQRLQYGQDEWTLYTRLLGIFPGERSVKVSLGRAVG